MKKTSFLTVALFFIIGGTYFYYDYRVDTAYSFSHEILVSKIPSWQDSSVRQSVHFALPRKQLIEDLEEPEDNTNIVALVDKVVVIPTVKIKEVE